MAILNNAVRHVTDGFIGILDMFGFEDGKPSQLEQVSHQIHNTILSFFLNKYGFSSHSFVSIFALRQCSISTTPTSLSLA